MTAPLLYAAVFIFGLALGSFLNVAGLRYRPDRFVFGAHSTRGRSHCMKCNKTLAWHELVPLVSFIYLRGRCRSCKHAISAQYPVVELLAGASLTAVPLYLFSLYGIPMLPGAPGALSWYYLLSAIWVLAFLALILISIIDYRQRIIPDELSAFLALLGIAKIGVLLYFDRVFPPLQQSLLQHYALLGRYWDGVLINHLLGAAFALLLLGLIVLITKGKGMGLGDVKLGAALGLLFGWPDIFLLIVLAFLAGALVTLPLLVRKAKALKDTVPFGPFLAAGAALTFFFGYAIVKAYFSLFSI